MKKIDTIVVEMNSQGHYCEYLRNLYQYAIEKSSESWVFVVNQEIKRYSIFLECSDRIRIIYVDLGVIKNRWSNYILRTIVSSVIAGCSAIRLMPRLIIVTSLIDYLPFGLVLNLTRIKLRGIIYVLDVYRWKEVPLYKRLADGLKNTIISKNPRLDKVFLLNDHVAPKVLNKIFKTKKFCYLPDPIPQSFVQRNECIATDELPQDGRKTVLIFGHLTRRKGVLDVLDAIATLSRQAVEGLCFVFAGELSTDVKDEFLRKVKSIPEYVAIVVLDEYIDENRLCQLVRRSSIILAPYHNCCQSSGVLGFSAQANKPILVPKSGFLYRVVRRFSLGFAYSGKNRVESLARAIENLEYYLAQEKGPFDLIKRNRYLSDKNWVAFAGTIMLKD